MTTASIFNHVGYSSSFFEGSGCDRELTNRLMSVYRDQFIQTWNSYLLRNHSIRGNSGNKLRLFKNKFDLEPYLLNVQNTSYRVALSRLRVGSHSLAIEVGRFHKPTPLPINDHLCSNCQSVENELHFQCICPRYSTLREDLEYVFLLQSTHTHINNLVAVFVHKSFRIRTYD